MDKTVFSSLRMYNHSVWRVVDTQPLGSFPFDNWVRESTDLQPLLYQARKDTVEEVRYLM